MGTTWRSRGTYGRILKKIIQRQLKRFENEQDPEKSIQLGHNVGYLISIQKDLIRDQSKEDIEERLEKLEQIAGITKKAVITN